MKTLLAIIAFIGSFQMLFAQGDTLLPLGQNSDILRPVQMKAGPDTFDSTFIYTSDTLEITTTKALLDDFSKDHFQKYIPDFTDPEITSDKTYKLLDAGTSLPLPVNAKFSNTPTTRKIVNVAAGTTVVEALASSQIKVGSFTSYPPVYSTFTVYPPYNLIDTLDFPNDTDTIPNVFFVQDSATQFFAQIHDQNAYWLDNYAYHNYRFAKNPWTLGVVTFDGLNQYGYPYNIGSTSSGQADVLNSKPIDMSSLNAAQEVYLSFLYQTEGFGDVPEATDSLALEFYAPAVDQWFKVWSAKGVPVSDFKKAHIRIQDVKYFQNGFQFRFSNYGGRSGSLDHFHIDYVHLRALSGAQDTLFKDFAMVYPLGSFLKDYTSVPWDHYKNNFAGKMNNAVRVVVRNGSNIAENSVDGSAWVDYEGVTEGNFVLENDILTAPNALQNYAPRTIYDNVHNFSNGYRFDENKAGDSQVFDLYATATSPFSQITVNDSTFGQQVFRNYYAYDDGSAEQAYGTTGNQSRLAYGFTPYEADSLIGVQMHFVPTVNDVSGNLFLLTVWNDGGGKPGTVIYEDNFFFPRQPVYEVGRNEFTNYYLKDTMKLPVSGTFYIGWRQLESEVLGIGFDRNTISSDKIFYSVDLGNTWINTTKQGSLLMRPIFSTALDATLGIPEERQTETFFEVYPNPVNDVIHFKIDPAVYAGAMLFDLQGKMILQVASDSQEADLSHLKSGVYIVREVNSGITRKIIKN